MPLNSNSNFFAQIYVAALSRLRLDAGLRGLDAPSLGGSVDCRSVPSNLILGHLNRLRIINCDELAKVPQNKFD